MILNKGAFTNCDSASLIYLNPFCNMFISVKVFSKEIGKLGLGVSFLFLTQQYVIFSCFDHSETPDSHKN